MRWTCFEPGRPREEAARAAMLESMDRFWDEFREGAEVLEDLLVQGGAESWLARRLQQVHPALMWEVGPGWRLSITSESERTLRPMVREMLRRAPALEGWTFTSWRMPVPPEDAEGVFRARTGADLWNLSFMARRGRHHRIDVRFDAPPELGFVACEVLLGEEILDRWVGEISQAKGSRLLGRLGRRRGRWRPVAELTETLAAHRAAVRALLPDRPLHELIPRADVAMYDLRPRMQHDYPRREDVVVGATGYPGMLRAALDQPDLFYSGRFSACGELFAYLKIEGIDSLGAFDDRTQVEGALDGRLVPTASGRVLGGATGVRYSYIDLALADMEGAVRWSRDILQRMRIPRRAWIQFFDPDLADEWLGVWPDSPVPPGMDA